MSEVREILQGLLQWSWFIMAVGFSVAYALKKAELYNARKALGINQRFVYTFLESRKQHKIGLPVRWPQLDRLAELSAETNRIMKVRNDE